MALIEIIRFEGKDADLAETVNTLSDSGALEKIRAEKGCVYFDFYLPTEKKGQILLLEKWESPKALELHHGTEMMADLLSLIKKYGLKLDVEKYDV